MDCSTDYNEERRRSEEEKQIKAEEEDRQSLREYQMEQSKKRNSRNSRIFMQGAKDDM